MNNRITKERLKNFFVYDFVKAFIACLLAGVLIALLFTTCATRTSNGQSFYLMLADNVSLTDDFEDVLTRMQSGEYEKYNFSYDVLEASKIQCQDAGSYSASYLMTMYLSTNQCDVFLGFDDRDPEDEESESLINTFINNGCAIEIYSESDDSYIQKAKTYALQFLTVNGDEVTVNEDLIKKEFQSKYGNDSRFEKDELYLQGLEDEKDRVKNVYLNAVRLEKIFTEHPEFLVQFTVNGEAKNYAINLSKLNGNNGKIIGNDVVCSSNTEEVTYDALMAVCNTLSTDGDMAFESLTYIVNLFSIYSTYLEA